MAFVADQESNIAAFGGSGGYSGLSGSWTMIILVVVVLWLLFRQDNNNNNDHYPHFPHYAPNPQYNSNCSIGTNVKDMPDYLVDRDVIAQGCKTRETEVAEAEKTRALITHNQERSDDKAYQALVLENLQKENAIQTLKLENNFQTRLSILGNEMERGFAGISNIVDSINCNMVKRPPYYAQGYVPCGYDIPPTTGRPHKELI